jgi:hypothetical protein
MSKVEIAVFSEVGLELFDVGPGSGTHVPQSTELQAERRGNFVVIGCVEGASVVSWSLHVRARLVFFYGSFTHFFFVRPSTTLKPSGC